MALSDFVDELGELAGSALETGRVQVAVKTNLGPEFRVGEGQGRLARALGIRAAVMVRDREGRTLFAYGDPPPTSWPLVTTLAAAAALAGYLLLRGLLKR